MRYLLLEARTAGHGVSLYRFATTCACGSSARRGRLGRSHPFGQVWSYSCVIEPREEPCSWWPELKILSCDRCLRLLGIGWSAGPVSENLARKDARDIAGSKPRGLTIGDVLPMRSTRITASVSNHHPLSITPSSPRTDRSANVEFLGQREHAAYSRSSPRRVASFHAQRGGSRFRSPFLGAIARLRSPDSWPPALPASGLSQEPGHGRARRNSASTPCRGRLAPLASSVASLYGVGQSIAR